VPATALEEDSADSTPRMRPRSAGRGILDAVGILLLVLGIVAGASGAVKLRGHARTGLGRPPLAAAEVVLGALLIAGSAAGLARTRPAAWTGVVLTALAVVVSSALHLRTWRRHWRRRRDSEGSRLEEYLELPRRRP
jgi:hypothetical protein